MRMIKSVVHKLVYYRRFPYTQVSKKYYFVFFHTHFLFYNVFFRDEVNEYLRQFLLLLQSCIRFRLEIGMHVQFLLVFLIF